MRHYLLLLTIAALLACDSAPPPRKTQTKDADVQTITTVRPTSATLDPPSVLEDEALPLRSNTAHPQTSVAFSPEDEKLRASLPFTPAIAMDPIDGSKISIRAATPTCEYKGKIYYFANEVNKRIFTSNPEHALKGGYMRL